MVLQLACFLLLGQSPSELPQKQESHSLDRRSRVHGHGVYRKTAVRVLHSGWEGQSPAEASVGEGPLPAQPSPGEAFSKTGL